MLLIVLCLICACQAVQKTKIDLLNLNSDVKVEAFNFDEEEYLFFGYKVTFDEAHVICLNYNAQLAIVDTDEKMEFIVQAMTNILEFGEFWVGTPSVVTAPLPWNDKKPKLSNDHVVFGDNGVWQFSGPHINNNNCLTVIRKSHSVPIFVPLQCSKKRPFICQRETDTFGTKIKEIDVIKVNNEEFTLYSARATWADAVVQCRQNGLQIAEVKSIKEAEAISMSMLRARPDAMENVWIGGYFKDRSWEWLASSEPITFNELWPNDTQLSFGCLLLDRHIAEKPIYVSAQCSRKRHVLCQKPPLKIFSKKPTPITVEGCPYVVGFYPLQWFEANRSCEAINASLVVLDSLSTIQHMMTLMAEYKQEIRHIWTDGQCRENRTSLIINNSKTWYWTSTGEPIPGLQSFIPWYTIQDDLEDADCLNLDREDYDTPIVYGLSCRKNQSYVCQPWEGRCFSHQEQDLSPKNSNLLNLYSRPEDIKPLTTPATSPAFTLSQNSSQETTENVSYVSDNMSNMEIIHSTESYYRSSVPHSTSQLIYKLENTTESVTPKDGEGKFDNENKFKIIKPYEVNQTNSQNLITDFFSPLIQFTLPSLPQFGIKIVRAEVTTPKLEVKKLYVSSKPKGSIPKIISRPAKINNRTPVIQNAVKDSKRNFGNSQQYKGDSNIKIDLKGSNKNSAAEKNEPKVKIMSPVTTKVNVNILPVTTEKIVSHSSGGLYGDDMDYLETSSSKPENTENEETTDEYDELIKSLDTSGKLIPLLNENKGNSKSDQPFGETLKKKLKSMIKSELKLKSNFQQTTAQISPKNRINIPMISDKPKHNLESISTNNMDFKNTEVRKDPTIQRHNTPDLIPPFYGFESPLKVELLDDGTGVTIAPVVLANQRNFEEKYLIKTENKLNATENKGNTLDFQLSNFNPHDKDSMLQLGRFLKQMFSGQNVNAQQIDFNLITRRDISEHSPQEIISQNEDKSQNTSATTTVNITPFVTTTPDYTTNPEVTTIPDYTTNPEVITTPIDITAPLITNIVQFIDENETSINCQKELEKIRKSTSSSDNLEVEYLQASCKNLPVSVPFAPFRIPRMSSKTRNEYNYQNSSPNVENSLFNVFKDLVKGIRIDIKEMQLKNYVNRFVQERLPNTGDFDFDKNSEKSWHEVFKKILNSLNGTAIRFHGERVLLRFGSFGYKKKSKSKKQTVTLVKATTPSESYDYTTSHRINDQDDQDQFKQNENFVLHLDSPILNEDQLNNTDDGEYLFSPAESKNKDFSNQNKNKRTRYKSNSRRVKQKTTSEVNEQDSLESNLKRWSHIRNEKEKSKKRIQVQGRERIRDYQDIKNKMFSPSDDWKSKTINSAEDVNNPKNYEEVSSNFNEQELQMENKLSKKSITEVNEENPFPDFPVINFDMRRTEDSFDSGFETIRVGRATRNDDTSSIVSVYIVMKHQFDEEEQQYSIPILELHIRMPADSLPLEEKHNPDYKTRSVEYQQIQDSKVTSKPKKLELKIIQEAHVTRRRKLNQNSQIIHNKTERKLKSRKIISQKHKKSRNQDRLKGSDQQNTKNKTEFNYEKANDFLRNIIENVTNLKTLPDLKRKRQLLYLALKYLRHVSDEKFKEQPELSEEKPFLGAMQETKENRKFNRSPMPNKNFRIQVPLPMQIGVDKKMIFNPTENELNPKPLMFNQMPMFNYNTRQYDDMAFNGLKRSYNPRIRRNVEQSKKSRSRLFFLHNAELNRK